MTSSSNRSLLIDLIIPSQENRKNEDYIIIILKNFHLKLKQAQKLRNICIAKHKKVPYNKVIKRIGRRSKMKTLITAFFKITFSAVMLYAIYFMVFHMDDMGNIYF